MKYCISCKSKKQVTEFWKNRSTKDGLQAYCKVCWYARVKARLNGPDRAIQLRQRQNGHLLRTFGITIEEYEELLASQGGRCAICLRLPSTKRKLAVDHRHEGEVIRGLLCEKCNRGLGHFDDDVNLLRSAIKYLE